MTDTTKDRPINDETLADEAAAQGTDVPPRRKAARPAAIWREKSASATRKRPRPRRPAPAAIRR